MRLTSLAKVRQGAQFFQLRLRKVHLVSLYKHRSFLGVLQFPPPCSSAGQDDPHWTARENSNRATQF